MFFFGKIGVQLANPYRVTRLHCYFHKQRKNFCWRCRSEFLASGKTFLMLIDFLHIFCIFPSYLGVISLTFELSFNHKSVPRLYLLTLLISNPIYSNLLQFLSRWLGTEETRFFYKKMDPVLKYNLGGIRLQTITIRFQSQLPLLLCTAPLANLHTLLKQNISKIFSAYFWNIPFALHQMQISTLSNKF